MQEDELKKIKELRSVKHAIHAIREDMMVPVSKEQVMVKNDISTPKNEDKGILKSIWGSVSWMFKF